MAAAESAETAEAAFAAALADDDARARFADRAALAGELTAMHAAARAAFPTFEVDATTFAGELARRLGAAASPDRLARTRTDHVYLAIACMAGDTRAIAQLEHEFFGEAARAAQRVRARPDQADEVRARIGRLLLVSEPGRVAALTLYSGRGDLGTYIRVIATRELVRMLAHDRREVAIDDQSFLDRLAPVSDPALSYLRETYRGDVDAALRGALASLDDEARALLRYSVIDGWTVDRIGELYGVHRATAARWVAAARDALATAVRARLATTLAMSTDQVDSVVRLVQSRVDVSLERLLS
jgi:RNA polymerase sigma-70 factor (ECF subfamily)|nr:helix-turn-helix domain-containing protein [Kofleriaceae bacterium]